MSDQINEKELYLKLATSFIEKMNLMVEMQGQIIELLNKKETTSAESIYKTDISSVPVSNTEAPMETTDKDFLIRLDKMLKTDFVRKPNVTIESEVESTHYEPRMSFINNKMQVTNHPEDRMGFCSE